MKKRSYRKISINHFQLEPIAKAIPKGRLIFAVDVAKVDMVAALAGGDGQSIAYVAWKNLADSQRLRELLEGLRGEGYEIEAVMEPSGTYGDVLRHQLYEFGVPVFRVSGKRTHGAKEVYDGVPSLHDAKSAALLAKLHVDGVSVPWPAVTEEKRELRAAVELMDQLRSPTGFQHLFMGQLHSFLTSML